MIHESDPALEYVDTATVPGEIWLIHGHRIIGVHLRQNCKGRSCVIHNPSIHHMRSMDLLYRDDRNIFERICEHGIGHPDPDQFSYWKEMGTEFEAVHGCDGCCREPKGWMPGDLRPFTEHFCSECGVLLAAVSQVPDTCEGCERDEYGVRANDCDCSTGHADNMDVEVCYQHRVAFNREKFIDKWETT